VAQRTTPHLGVALLSLATALAVLAPAAHAEVCPNEQLRAETNSTRLPDCRVYQQVSPQNKNGQQAGGSVAIQEGRTEDSPTYGVASADGHSVGYGVSGGEGIGTTPTGFDEFAASRLKPEGWQTTSAIPHGRGFLGFFENHVSEFTPSPDFSHYLFSADGPYVGPPALKR